MLSNYLNVFLSFEIVLLRILFRYVPHFAIGLFGMSSFLSSLYILKISPLSDVGLEKNFSNCVGCCFVLLTVSFALQMLIIFRRSHLLNVDLSVCTTGEGYFQLFFY